MGIDQDEVQTEEQDAADFMAGFNGVRDPGEESPEPRAEEPKEEQDPEEATAEIEESEPLFFGMTESQVKSLLERSARVDSIEEQLRKANGKIGELNGTLQTLSAQRKAAPDPSEGDDGSDLENDFPEFRDIADARARKIASEMIQEYAKNNIVQPGPDRDEIIRDANIAIMDATYDGWRETLSSQDFSLWIATQPDNVQQTYQTTVSAKELGTIVKTFDAWKTNAQSKGNRNKQRLEQAIIPEGNSSRVKHAPSPQDDFLAGFNSVRNQT